MSQSERFVEGEQVAWPRMLRRCALACGLISPIVFTLVNCIEAITRPGYNVWRQSISALSLSSQGWIQITNYVVCGFLICCFAGGLRSALPSGKGAMWVPLLLVVVGLSLIICGFCVADSSYGYPPGTPDGAAVHRSLRGILHFLFSVIAGLALPGACFALQRGCARSAAWQGWGRYSLGTALLMLTSFAAYLLADLGDGPAGLLERLAIFIGVTWVFCLAVKVCGQAGAPDEQGNAERRGFPADTVCQASHTAGAC